MMRINIIEQLTIKQKILIGNIISLIFTSTSIYALLEFLLIYKLNFFRYTASQSFLYSILIVIFCFMAWKVIKATINPKEYQKFKSKKRRRPKVNTHPKQTQYKPTGTWLCPRCGFLAKGQYCKKCNYKEG